MLAYILAYIQSSHRRPGTVDCLHNRGTPDISSKYDNQVMIHTDANDGVGMRKRYIRGKIIVLLLQSGEPVFARFVGDHGLQVRSASSGKPYSALRDTLEAICFSFEDTRTDFFQS